MNLNRGPHTNLIAAALGNLEKQKIKNTEKLMNDLRAASVYGSMNLQYNFNTKRPFTPYRPIDYNYYRKLVRKYSLFGGIRLSPEQLRERGRLLAPIRKHALFVSRGAEDTGPFGPAPKYEHPANRRKRKRNTNSVT